jgi:hypothetical protein
MFTLMMEELHSSETLVLTEATWRDIPVDVIQKNVTFNISSTVMNLLIGADSLFPLLLPGNGSFMYPISQYIGLEMIN